jgi:hypothetical protein
MKSINTNVTVNREVHASGKGHQENGLGWSGSSPPSNPISRVRNRERRVNYNCISCGKACLGANKNAKFCPPPSACRTQYRRRNYGLRGQLLTRANEHCERCGQFTVRLCCRGDSAICGWCNSAVSAEIAGSSSWQRKYRRSNRLGDTAVAMKWDRMPRVIPFCALVTTDVENHFDAASVENELATHGVYEPDFVNDLLDSLEY